VCRLAAMLARYWGQNANKSLLQAYFRLLWQPCLWPPLERSRKLRINATCRTPTGFIQRPNGRPR
jgi:hypothetical protein